MRDPDGAIADRISNEIANSAKYRTLHDAVIRRMAADEVARRRTVKEAESCCRARLHQAFGAYVSGKPPYAKWLNSLSKAESPDEYDAAAHSMLAVHTSTRERLAFLDELYTRTLAAIRPVRSILDLACGLNGLAFGQMGVGPDCTYTGVDLCSEMMMFVQAALRCDPYGACRSAVTLTADLQTGPPSIAADLALVLKFLPLLELDSPGRTLSWIQSLQCRHVLVSFPTRSLGGRNVGMAGTHESRFREVAAAGGWPVEKFEFANELCFLVTLDYSGAESTSIAGGRLERITV